MKLLEQFNFIMQKPRYLELNGDPVGCPPIVRHFHRAGLYAAIVTGGMIAATSFGEGVNKPLRVGVGAASAVIFYLAHNRYKDNLQRHLSARYGRGKVIDTEPIWKAGTDPKTLGKIKEDRDAICLAGGMAGVTVATLSLPFYGLTGALISSIPLASMALEDGSRFNKILSGSWVLVDRPPAQQFKSQKKPLPLPTMG